MFMQGSATIAILSIDVLRIILTFNVVAKRDAILRTRNVI